MPLRGIVLGLGLAFVALGWWRVLRRLGREVDGKAYRFNPSVVTSRSPTTRAIPRAPTSRSPGACTPGSVTVTVLYLAFACYAFLG